MTTTRTEAERRAMSAGSALYQASLRGKDTTEHARALAVARLEVAIEKAMRGTPPLRPEQVAHLQTVIAGASL